MIQNTYGIIGLGMVWGWYLGMFIGHVHDKGNTFPALVTTILVVFGYILWHSGVAGLPLIFISMVSSLLVHMLWRRALQMRYRLFGSKQVGGE